jgi:hypothetical protein
MVPGWSVQPLATILAATALDLTPVRGGFGYYVAGNQIHRLSM